MKKLILILLALTLYIAPRAHAEIGVGYELLGIYPHSFNLTVNDKVSGWGMKASADLGSSMFSTVTSIFTSLFSFNISRVSFYTLSLTKDYYQDELARSYFKLGAMAIQAQGSAGQNSSAALPIVGIGFEWRNLMSYRNLAGTLELSFPEVFMVGVRYLF